MHSGHSGSGPVACDVNVEVRFLNLPLFGKFMTHTHVMHCTEKVPVPLQVHRAGYRADGNWGGNMSFESLASDAPLWNEQCEDPSHIWQDHRGNDHRVHRGSKGVDIRRANLQYDCRVG